MTIAEARLVAHSTHCIMDRIRQEATTLEYADPSDIEVFYSCHNCGHDWSEYCTCLHDGECPLCGDQEVAHIGWTHL